MPERSLRLVVRTPRACVFDERIHSLRVPTDTGQVGIRPRVEPAALVVEPGLVLAAGEAGLHFLATAGGLLRCDRDEGVLLTPLAVVGESAPRVVQALDEALASPGADVALRNALQHLETGILRELRGMGDVGTPASGFASRGGAPDA
ncbi:MAG: hypothetical protein KC616_17390 [Myxococcales bacterium]|nr:hypothetical protein [Myxococcales bacterium]